LYYFNSNTLKKEPILFSIGDARKKLPPDYVQGLTQLFPAHTADKILLGCLSERCTTLRVNTLKSNISALMEELKKNQIKFDRVSWYKDALILKNCAEKEIEKTTAYQEGQLYLQSLSSMIPPLVLDPKPNETILDLTAAPGSKTTQLAALMQNKGYLLANELDKIRYEKLKFNLGLQRVQIAVPRLGKGEKIGAEKPEYFDRVLLDAPCSGEGLFIVGQPQTTRYWSLKLVSQLASLQKKLFTSAFLALKKGGILVYSTCTLNKTENEEIVQWALENFDLQLLNIPLAIPNANLFNPSSTNKIQACTLKIFPTKTLEGFFVSRFKKN